MKKRNELTKALLRGPRCPNCISKKLHRPSWYCERCPEEPTYEKQCLCEEFKSVENFDKMISAISRSKSNMVAEEIAGVQPVGRKRKKPLREMRQK